MKLIFAGRPFHRGQSFLECQLLKREADLIRIQVIDALISDRQTPVVFFIVQITPEPTVEKLRLT